LISLHTMSPKQLNSMNYGLADFSQESKESVNL